VCLLRNLQKVDFIIAVIIELILSYFSALLTRSLEFLCVLAEMEDFLMEQVESKYSYIVEGKCV
jgi:hypothetical protein